MRLEANSNRLKISNWFEKLFRLDGDLTGATFPTIVRCYCICANNIMQKNNKANTNETKIYHFLKASQ